MRATPEPLTFRRAVLGLRVIHPLPSALNAALVIALAIVAGAPPIEAGLLALAMLGFQASIGALNDVADADRDQLAKPTKPIPAGVIDRRGATIVAMAGAAVGLAISAGFGLPVLILGAAGYGCGLAYDLVMRRRGQGWVCYAGAFPLLLAWTWMAAAGSLPPGWPLLLPLAALAGPTIHLANSLVDLDADEQAGVTSLATSLGEDRAPLVLTILTASIYVLAWVILLWLTDPPIAALLTAAAATLCAGLGVGLSWRSGSRAREQGWLLQAAGLALLAVAWVAAANA
jgi:4-hydroxybenzoate polyprenyltransferase